MSYKKNSDIVSVMRIRDLIDKSGLTREEIAKKLDIGTSTVTQYYNGNRNLTIDSIKKFSKLFNVSTDYIFGISDAKTSNTTVKAISDYTGLNDEAINTLHILNGLMNDFDKTIERIRKFKKYRETNPGKLADIYTDNRTKIDAYDNIEIIILDYLEEYLISSSKESKENFKIKIIEICMNALSFYNCVMTLPYFLYSIKDLSVFQFLTHDIVERYTLNPTHFIEDFKRNHFGSVEISEAYLRMYEAKDSFNEAIIKYSREENELLNIAYEELLKLKNESRTKTEVKPNGNDNETE